MARNNEYIEKRKESYRVKIPYCDSQGQKGYISHTFTLKKYGSMPKALEMAKKFRDEAKVKIANGMVIKEKHYTLDQVFNGMMELRNCSLGTKKKEAGTYNRYIRTFIGADRVFSSIKFDDIQKCLNTMVSTCKDDTIQRTKSIWNRLYRYAIAKEIVIKDETYNVVIPKSDIITIKKPMETSFDEVMEAVKLIDERITNRRDSILMQGALLIMWYTGMRPGEVMALDKRNIDLDCKTIFVCQSVGSTSTEAITIKRTKNEYSIRYVPVVEDLLPVFDKLYAISKGDLLFMRDNGEMMTGNFLSSVCQRLTHNTFRPYTIRHQFSTDLITNGADPRTTQELMGHKESTMTIGYARSNEELKRKALEMRKYN